MFKEPLICMDVDDTLVSWSQYESEDASAGAVKFFNPRDNKYIWLNVIQEHIDAIKAHKLRGHTVIIWSAGGVEWAQVVVDTLGLTPYVDACMAKPNWYYDDVPSSEFMPEFNRKHARLKKRLSNEA